MIDGSKWNPGVMRLSCEVQLSSRLMPTLGIKKSGKPARCQIALGRKPASVDKIIYLMVSTNQNPSGNMFKIHANVEAVFCKFLDQGKINIRLKEPATDILISKADSTQLKTFIQYLKLVITKGSLDESQQTGPSKLSCLTPVTGKALDKLKTKTIILERRNYPITDGFSPTLKHLQISNCNLKRLDNRIINLKHLVYLDMSHNKLTSVPQKLKELGCLSALILNNNLISEFSSELCTVDSHWCGNLRTLDLSGNAELTSLPTNIVNLSSLNTLKADNCSITHLPSRFGELSSLKTLSLSENKLKTLPYSFLKLRLDELNFYLNPFLESSQVKSRLSFPTLGEFAARAIKSHKVPVTQGMVFPDLWNYLNSAKWCPCGKPCFVSFACFLAPVDLRSLVTSTCHNLNSVGGSTSAPVEAFLCSQKCLNLYHENPRRRKW